MNNLKKLKIIWAVLVLVIVGLVFLVSVVQVKVKTRPSSQTSAK